MKLRSAGAWWSFAQAYGVAFFTLRAQGGKELDKTRADIELSSREYYEKGVKP